MNALFINYESSTDASLAIDGRLKHQSSHVTNQHFAALYMRAKARHLWPALGNAREIRHALPNCALLLNGALENRDQHKLPRLLRWMSGSCASSGAHLVLPAEALIVKLTPFSEATSVNERFV